MSYHLQEINRRIQADPKEFVDASDAAYAAKIERAAHAIAENAHTCPIVLLSGPSGSGKTTTAMKIAEALCKLGVGSQSLAMDDYFRTVDLRTAPRTPEGDLDLESPACLDMDLLGKHLNALARGEEIHLPRYNFVTRVQSGPIGRPMRLGKDEVVVCEGIHALNDEIAAYCPDAFRLYISARSVVVDDDGNEVFKGTWMRGHVGKRPPRRKALHLPVQGAREPDVRLVVPVRGVDHEKLRRAAARGRARGRGALCGDPQHPARARALRDDRPRPARAREHAARIYRRRRVQLLSARR